MIFARDKSQMCNNLLQFAHVYAWAREHDRSVMSMRFSYKYRFFKICHTKYTSFPMYLFAKYAAALRLLPTARFKQNDDPAVSEQLMARHKHVVVSGWFCRWYDLFLKYRSEICDLFTIDSQYSTAVSQRMSQCEAEPCNDRVRLGVHIRRGDYKDFQGGKYFYSDEKYAAYIDAFAQMMQGKQVEVYLSTNDPEVTADKFRTLVKQPNAHIHLLGGNAVEDLSMLSECDYVMGPPSTYSLVAVMYRDIPLLRMDTAQAATLTPDDFKLFDYWFRRII